MGNQQKLRQAGVKALAKDIADFDANTIEYVGHNLIQILEGKSLIHRGVNRDGKPAGYTVDTFSADRKVVGEYSTETGYFDTPFDKITKDASHVLALAHQCCQLYLISNKQCRNCDWPEVTETVTKILGKDCKIEIYDRDRLAAELYDQVIVKNSLVEFFSDFLPSLWKIWTENAISNSAPPMPQDYVEDESRMELLENRIDKDNVVAFYGISGGGKTYFATTYTQRKRDEFRNTIWISGKELEGIVNLSSVKIARLGVEINLASHLSASPTLLVVDDFKGDASNVAKLLPEKMHEGTKVLITCIGRPSETMPSVEVPSLSKPTAKEVLTMGLDNAPSPDQFDTICTKVGYHALTLAIIRDTVRETKVSWGVIVEDLENVPNYEGNDQQTILQRILLRHSDGVANELRSLKFLGTVALDGLLALSILGPSGLSKLLRRSIIQKDSRGMCRMHDLVFACLQHYEGGNISKNEVETKLKSFLISECETGSYHFQRSLQIHSDLIASWVNLEHPKPSAESYLFQLTERLPKSPEFLESLRLESLRLVISSKMPSLSIIEAIEQRYWREQSQSVRSQVIEEGIKNISSALQQIGDTPLKTDLLHHRGKLQFWSNHFDLAIRDFEEVLTRDAKAFQAHLQLARVKARKGDNSCIQHIELILNTFTEADDSVSITIVLAAFSELAKKPYQNMRGKYLTSGTRILGDAISLAVAEGFSQPYRALSQVGRYVFYECPEEVISMAEHVSFPASEVAKPKDCFNIAELMKSIGKAYTETSAESLESEFWLNRALGYYDRMDNNWEFNLTMKAECLIRLDRFEDALIALEECASEKHSPHWWHRRALAFIGLEDFDKAMSSISKALLENDDERYESAFLQIKAQIEASKGLECAVTTLNEAIEKTTNDKFKATLELELIDLKNKLEG